MGQAPLAYVEHDGRVFTVVRDGRRTLPPISEVRFPIEERGRLRAAGADVVVAAARLPKHPTDWIAKDDVPTMEDADAVLRAAVLASLYRPVVGVVAVKDGKLLLVRPSRGVVAGRWTLPGGFLEPFEDPESGARREMKEETGLDAGRLRLLGAWLHRSAALPFPILGLAYGCSEWTGSVRFDADEIAELKWEDIGEARKRTTGMAREVVERWEGVIHGMA